MGAAVDMKVGVVFVGARDSSEHNARGVGSLTVTRHIKCVGHQLCGYRRKSNVLSSAMPLELLPW